MDILQIPLTRGKFAIVDERDAEWLNEWRWNTNNTGYAMRRDNETGKTILMHREIYSHYRELPSGVDLDHRDRNKLNNSLSNLRPASRSQNVINGSRRMHNTSGVAGVAFHKRIGKWQAYITQDGKRQHLGYFKNFEDAVAIRKAVMVDCFGEYANLSDDLSTCPLAIARRQAKGMA